MLGGKSGDDLLDLVGSKCATQQRDQRVPLGRRNALGIPSGEPVEDAL
jgi:hypothetical protein